MKIYTKVGDGGNTQLFAGSKVSKDHARIEAYGTIDELSAVIGTARVSNDDPQIDQILCEIQNDLFSVGAELATEDPVAAKTNFVALHHVQKLEAAIDRFEAHLTPLKTFILPGGSLAAAQLHAARTVCRRAERRIVTLGKLSDVSSELIPFVNRLSDLLFVLARYANLRNGVDDVPWVKPN